jgi:hypothetical protein
MQPRGMHQSSQNWRSLLDAWSKGGKDAALRDVTIKQRREEFVSRMA